MKERDMEKMIRDAVNDATPDKLGDIFAELGIDKEVDNRSLSYEEENNVVTFTPSRNKKRIYKTVASLAAALVICIAGTMMQGISANKVAAVINLDVNPSIEISVNEKRKVIEALAVNHDGEEILEGMDLKGTEIKVAASAIVGSMLQHGYLDEITNSVLVSVKSEDKAKGEKLEMELASGLKKYLEECAVGAAVLGQCVTSDENILQLAEENGISLGKAQLIRLLASDDGRMTEEALLKLSTQELLQLACDREDVLPSGTLLGEANCSQYVSKDKILLTALTVAELKENQVRNCIVKLDCDDGQMVYDVDFTTKDMEYELEFDAMVGTLLEIETKVIDTDLDTSDFIGEERAIEIAFAKAGVSGGNVEKLQIEMDGSAYEVEFVFNHVEYEVKIDGETGDVTRFEIEYLD